MPSTHRHLWIICLSAALLSACGSSSYDRSYGSAGVAANGPPPPVGKTGNPTGNPAGSGVRTLPGSADTVITTPSVAGAVSLAAGTANTISVSFNSSDGRAISGFGISGNMGSVPPNWSAPPSFSCASVSTGGGCVLNLTYAPTLIGSGTVTLDCVFVNNATTPNTPGPCVSIPFIATAHNNVVAAASAAGQITAVAGVGKYPVSVSFTTDDGNAASDLAVTTDLSALPPGWSSSAPSLSCAIVSTGSGCQVTLMYAPTAAGSGTLTLNYTYLDGTGTAQSGGLNIPYSTATHGIVVAGVSPQGQVNAAQKTGKQAVGVTFTTDDGKPASGLAVTSDLAGLPAGWHSSRASFSCNSVGTGNTCQLPLSYAPAALGQGTLTLRYMYNDSAGAAKAGLINIAYAATSDDNVAGTAAPSGQIATVVGSGSQTVLLTFTTDDARTATSLAATGLASLPAGWQSAATFTCESLTNDAACQLPLIYAPTAADNGVLMLNYGYVNNAGLAKTGSVAIPYRATTDNTVVGTPMPTPPLAVKINTSTQVNIDFASDDGNPASALTITSGLSPLPTDWSSTSNSFSCSSVSGGTACRLSLSYAPLAVGSGTLNFIFGYTNNSGTLKTGVASLAYSAAP